MKRCICHHWIPPTECYVLGAPRIRWGGVREALGGPGGGGPWGALGGGVTQSICSRKPPYKIHEDLRDSSGKEKLSVAMVESTGRLRYFEWDRSETIFGNFSSRPTQIQRHQEKFRHEGGEQEGRAMAPYRTPFAPPFSSGTPTASQSWCLWFWTALTI